MKKLFSLSVLVIFLFSSFTLLGQRKYDNSDFSKNPNAPTKSFGQIPFSTEGIVTITHSSSQTIVTGSVSCNASGLHTDNSYWRAFNLPSFGISEDYSITDVSIGVDQAIGNGGTQPITCNLYVSSPPFPGGYPASLTLIGTTSINVPDQSLSIFNIPVTGVAPVGSELVVEIFTPDGQATGNSFFIGSNSLGQTGPSYINATDCGIPTPTDLAAIGFPNMHIVMNVTGDVGITCPIGDPTDPNPADLAINVPLSTSSVSWTNPVEAISTTLWFGTDPNNLTNVQSGSLSNSWNITPTLQPATEYFWRVEVFRDTCSKLGQLWSFTTESNAIQKFFDDFEANTDSLPAGWVVTNDGGTGVWGVYPNPNIPVWPNTYTLPCGAGCGKVLSADSDYWESGSNLLSTARIDQTFDATNYTVVSIEFDQDFNDFGGPDEGYVEVSTDGGSTWTIIWSQIGADLRNTHEVVDISSVAAGNTFQVQFRSVQPFWDWWWTVDNVAIYNAGFIPVELTSFTTSVIGGKVNLNWQTATETNNYGFEVERKTPGQEFTKVGFVGGYGTTTEVKNYSFVDNSVTSGSYTYRLKQVDLDGTFEYSSEVEVDLAPASYSLAQNYPNPFNPSTKIDFSLASDSKVTLKIFDVLGQEVITLINGNLSAGVHSQNFDASSINSGVYFYTIEAVGVDGSNFSSTKKMMLTK
ncbi:MAG: T9SS type A sorting domain-containing protein [Ignavibacteria bacterium]|nr:T9SS type A sorting domain-containing protein [Ignavibacteria bacterium]